MLVSLWLLPEILLEFFGTGIALTQVDVLDVLSWAGLTGGVLLVGSTGAGLLTGIYHEHRQAFVRAWAIVGVFAIVSAFLGWTATFMPY